MGLNGAHIYVYFIRYTLKPKRKWKKKRQTKNNEDNKSFS